MNGLTCIHSPSSLCPKCQEDYDEDPQAWLEYGDHPSGIENSRRLKEEMNAEAIQEPTPPAVWDEIPF